MDLITMAQFASGFLISEVLDLAYDRKFNGIEGGNAFLHALEHYHWGLLSLNVGHPVFIGVGLGFIFDEVHGDKRFGVRKKHFRESCALGILFSLLLALRWLLFA